MCRVTLEERLGCFLAVGPTIAGSAFIAEGAHVVGDVRLGANVSVWHCAVLRGDINFVEIGDRTNIQDGAIVHVADAFPAIIGRNVTVGHGAVIHACTVGEECLVGMRAVILDGAVIGAGSIIGAGAVVTQGTVVPPGSLVLGMPARVVRPLTVEERASLRASADKYVGVAAAHARAAGWTDGRVSK
jgi:carbonic anhydrase/acetyltransferase-like protein (isoleucine patch superfamily)